MAQILQSISHFWMPWHGVTEENRISSGNQHLPADREGKKMDSVVGATVVQNAADVDQKFQKGIQAIWRIIQDIAGAPVPHQDKGGKTGTLTKLFPAILEPTRTLFKVSAISCDICQFIFITKTCSRDLLGNHSMHDTPLIKNTPPS
jgi:hypothetical protein